MNRLLEGIRYGLRSLIRHPGFGLLSILTLAVGIGVNCAIFSIVNAILLRPLPFEEPDRLMSVWGVFSQLDPGVRFPLSDVELVDLEEDNQAFVVMAGYFLNRMNLTGTEVPEQIQTAVVTQRIFQALGVNASEGRTFSPEEAVPGGPNVVVLSHASWQRRFGGETSVLGETLILDGAPFTVVGVMPQGFDFPESPNPLTSVEMWVLGVIDPSTFPAVRWGNFGRFLSVIARLKEGVSLSQARANFDAIERQYREEYPDAYTENSGWGLRFEPLLEAQVGKLRPALRMLLGAGILVLLVACVNVANLLLTRARGRQREVALRTAIGADQRRIFQLLLSESLFLSILGGALGVLMAYGGLKLLLRAAPDSIPRLDSVSLDVYVLGFTLLVIVVSGVLTAVVPFVQLRRSVVFECLKEGGSQSGSGVTGQRFRSVLGVFEVAMALVVLIGSGLLLKNFTALKRIDPGFDVDRILTMKISLPGSRYRSERIIAFYRSLIERVDAISGTEMSGLVSHLPLVDKTSSDGVSYEGSVLAPGEMAHEVDFFSVSDGYFETMKIQLLDGRDFTAHDNADSVGVAIVDERLAKRFWPDENPIGKRLKSGRPDSESPWRTVIGVVEHVKHEGVHSDLERDQLYYSFLQVPRRTASLAIRTESGDPMSVLGTVRGAIREMDEELPVAAVQTMKQGYARSLAAPRFSMLLLCVFGAVSLLLVIIGVYSVTAASTTERTHEIGIRMAMGARRIDVVKLVMAENLVGALAGIAIGLVGAFFGSRLLASQLYDMSSTDRWTFVTITILLIGIVAVASLVPALRASTQDPHVVLRQD